MEKLPKKRQKNPSFLQDFFLDKNFSPCYNVVTDKTCEQDAVFPHPFRPERNVTG